MGKLHHPHDQFFKVLFSNIEVARVFLQHFLPDDLTKQLDLSTLRVTSNTFLTYEMTSQFADLVLECAIKDSGPPNLLISFLYEHKSTPDKFALLQVEDYLLKAYRKQIAEKKGPLRLVVPILYYHGEEDWHPKNLREKMDYYSNKLRKFAPDFDYFFLNITLLSDEEIKDFENNFLVPVLLIQKYFKNLEQLQKHLSDIFYFLDLMEDEGNYKTNYFVYLIDLFNEDKRTFMSRIEELELLTRDKTKNFLLQMIEEGREELREKSIRKMIRNGSSDEFICDVMEVTPDYIDRIRASMN